MIRSFLPVALLAFLCVSHAGAQAPGWFVNVSDSIHMNVDSTFRNSLADVNNDNYPDVVSISTEVGTLYTNRIPIKVFLNVDDSASSNPSDRKFIDITQYSRVNVVPPDTGQNACVYTLADFNNDGNIDLVTGIYYHRLEGYTLVTDRPQVYLGDGAGRFTAVPNSGISNAGLFNIREFSALDYDRDGILDLFVAVWFYDYTNEEWDHAYLFKGNGDGTFTNVSQLSGVDTKLEPNYGSAATDYNNDCYPDMFTSPYCRTGGSLWKNNGNGTFTQIGDSTGSSGYNLFRKGDGGQASCTFSTVPEDVDNDGDIDLFLCVVHGGNDANEFRSTIAMNQGAANNYVYDINYSTLPTDAPRSPHRGDYNAAFLDFDNDGLKDAVMTQGTYGPGTDHTYFWRQNENHTFTDVTRELGFITSGTIMPEMKSTGGIEPFDYDLDGDDDLIMTSAAGATTVWKNTVGNSNSWIGVKLEAQSQGINRSCIGARIYVYFQGKMIMREVMAGRGQHAGQAPFILNFGLGNATGVDSIMVRWPNANCETTVTHNPQMNSIVRIMHRNVGIDEAGEKPFRFSLFPNPTSNYMIVQSEGLTANLAQVSVSDMTGRDLTPGYYKSDSDKLIFNVSALPEGLYLVKVTLKNNVTYTQKLIRQ